MRKQYRETFNDGVLVYGHKTSQRSVNGKRIGETFVPEGRLAFQEMSHRDQDYQMANVMSSSLDLKVKTLFPPLFKKVNKSKLKAHLRGIEYDVIQVDKNPDGTRLFFYLQEVGPVDDTQ